jgi:vacuolar iron transporter family protein
MSQSPTLDKNLLKLIVGFQQTELTESEVYRQIALRVKDVDNKKILLQIADDEKRHCGIWESYTNKKLKPQKFLVFIYVLLFRLFGFTFAVRLMEKGEGNAKHNYRLITERVPEAKIIEQEEDQHEEALLDMLNERALEYVGSMVLGMNDALVELTGALAGLTMAINDMKLMALSGLVTGISAAFSMAASDYLSARAEGNANAKRSAIYTGITYFITVMLLTAPYVLFGLFSEIQDAGIYKWYALGIMLTVVIVIIATFNFYIAVAKKEKFLQRFTEMALISLGVATLSFFIGIAVKNFLGIE